MRRPPRPNCRSPTDPGSSRRGTARAIRSPGARGRKGRCAASLPDGSQSVRACLRGRVHRPKVQETTALGAAWLAGMRAGLYPGPAEFARAWALDRRFEPRMAAEERDTRYAGWRDAVGRTLTRRT